MDGGDLQEGVTNFFHETLRGYIKFMTLTFYSSNPTSIIDEGSL
jgi:hypothetical protein